MNKFLCASIALMSVCVALAADSCNKNADCSNGGVCSNNNCSCLGNYIGPKCEYEKANCTHSEVRVLSGDYHICIILSTTQNGWGSICSHVDLCNGADQKFPSCKFTCGANCTAGCLYASAECKAETNTIAACHYINGAPSIRNLSHFLFLFAICSMLLTVFI